MNLMGLNQNLVSVPKADNLSASTDNSQLSNQSSDKFKNTLDRFSANSDNSGNQQSRQPGEKLTESRDSANSIQSRRMPSDHQPYRKPVTSVPANIPRQSAQADGNLADEQIQSRFEDAQEMAAGTPKNATVDSLTRRAAIQSFMQKMETQLGIEPSEIVEAFQKLSFQELAAPPEQNVEKIISFLQLDTHQQQTARTFFDEMLTQSSAQSIAEYLKATDRELSLSVMSQNQMRQEQLQRGLANMNQQFFTQPQQSAKVAAVTPQQSHQQNSSGFWATGVGVAGLAGYAASEAVGASAQTGAGAGQASASGLGPMMQSLPVAPNAAAMSQFAGTQNQVASSQKGMELGSQWTAPAETSPLDVAEIEKMISATKNSIGKSAYGLNPQTTPQVAVPKGLDSYSMPEPGMGLSEASPDWQLSGVAAGGQQDSAGNPTQHQAEGSNVALQEMVDAGELTEAEGMEFQVKAESGAATANGSAPTGSKAPSFMLTNQPTESEQAQNVKEVVTHANLLVKKGGGEMKVALNPEGMGQVNLKVAVQDGQVTVEMVTESNDAKKLLEKGLGDLKANLASHKLNVDNVKVDFSGEIAKQFDHAHDEAQRQSAQNFMEQFRHQNQSWRQDFFDIPGARSSGHPNEGGPQDELTQVQSGKSKTSSRRLDLVA